MNCNSDPVHELMHAYPPLLIKNLQELEQESGLRIALVGGIVRDWLLGETTKDIDIAVENGALSLCYILQKKLGGGAVVPLGRQDDEAARLVWKDFIVDIANFRKGATTLVEDLHLRDFTVNAMGVFLSDLFGASDLKIIDPTGGKDDLSRGILRMTRDSYGDDPLRMLRGFRLCASLGLTMEKSTRDEISKHASSILDVSVERITYELNAIMDSSRAHEAIEGMVKSGLFFYVFPEMEEGVGLGQPSSHHLDVFNHCLETLKSMEVLQNNIEKYFSATENLETYLAEKAVRRGLKWAALFHDLGKPSVHAVDKTRDGRITFYNHDRVGRSIFQKMSTRLRWSHDETEYVANLIELHMHPFHLCNVQRKEGVSRKAALKLVKKAGKRLKGLFLLAMADCLASRGEKAPDNMLEELQHLFSTLQETIVHIIEPVLQGPRLINGNDLQEVFNIKPGPIYSTILKDLELAQVEGDVNDRIDALRWVAGYLKKYE